MSFWTAWYNIGLTIAPGVGTTISEQYINNICKLRMQIVNIKFCFYFNEIRVVCFKIWALLSELIDESCCWYWYEYFLSVVISHGSAEFFKCHIVVLLHLAPKFGHLVWFYKSVMKENVLLAARFYIMRNTLTVYDLYTNEFDEHVIFYTLRYNLFWFAWIIENLYSYNLLVWLMFI